MSDAPAPRPWRSYPKFETDDTDPWWIRDARMIKSGEWLLVAECTGDETANLIITAVNEHDALKAEVERLRAELNRLRPSVVWTEQDVETWRECLG